MSVSHFFSWYKQVFLKFVSYLIGLALSTIKLGINFMLVQETNSK